MPYKVLRLQLLVFKLPSLQMPVLTTAKIAMASLIDCQTVQHYKTLDRFKGSV